MVKNHYSGKTVKRYYVITNIRTTAFQSGKNANALYEKLRSEGFDVKLKTRRVDKGEEYKRRSNGEDEEFYR